MKLQLRKIHLKKKSKHSETTVCRRDRFTNIVKNEITVMKKSFFKSKHSENYGLLQGEIYKLHHANLHLQRFSLLKKGRNRDLDQGPPTPTPYQ